VRGGRFLQHPKYSELRVTRSAVLLVLDALAVFRLTRLVTADGITAPWRDWIARGGRPISVEFVNSPWCVSFWFALIVVGLQHFVPGPWLYAAAVLAFSAVAGFLAERSLP